MNVSRSGAWVRGLVLVSLAILTPIGAALEAGKPLDNSVWVSAIIAALVALRAFLDQSLSRIDDTSPTP